MFNTIRRIETQIIQRNEQQLENSKDANNVDLFSSIRNRGTYSRATELITNGRKQEGDKYTLFDTGDFIDGMFLNVSGDRAIFGSTDSKTGDLVREYGEIFGLTDDNLRAVIQSDILPFLQQYTRNILDI